QTLWNHSQVINLLVPGQREPWARVWTKRPTQIDLALTGPKGRFAMGKVASFGVEPEFDATREDVDVVKLRFVSEDHLHRENFAEFLREHAAAIAENGTGRLVSI